MSLEQLASVSFAFVNGAGGAGAFTTTTSAFTKVAGTFASCTRASAGVYTVVSTTAYVLAATQVICSVIGGAGSANAQVTSADGLTFNVTTFVTAAATDENFMLTVTPVNT